MKVFIIISAVAVLAYLLVKRTSVQTNADGTKVTDSPGVGSGIVDAECAVFSKFGFGIARLGAGDACTPGSKANRDAKQSYSQLFTKGGAQHVGVVAGTELRSASTLFGALDYVGGPATPGYHPVSNPWRGNPTNYVPSSAEDAAAHTTTPLNAWRE